MARLLLIRHAPSPETSTRLTGRTPGVSLDEKGREVARATGRRIRRVKLRRVYTSPMERTRDTAEEIAAFHGLEPEIHQGLNEVDFGSWAGRTYTSLYRTKLWREVTSFPSRTRFPGGESLREAQQRAVAACEEIAGSAGKSTVAAVSHADLIKSIVAHYLGLPLDLFQRLTIGAASISAIDIPSSGPARVLCVNDQGEDPWR